MSDFNRSLFMIVIFDTSVLSKIYHTHPFYKNLCELSQRGKIKIYIPYVVKREIETQRTQEVEEQYRKSIKELLELNKLTGGFGEINEISEKTKSMKDSLIEYSRSKNEAYFHDLRAITAEIDVEQTIKALEAYFLGNRPLTNPKNRNDIPDSFICQSIYTIADKNPESNIIVVASDKKIVNTFEKDVKFTIFKTLDGFFNFEYVKEMLKDIYEYPNTRYIIDFLIKDKRDDIRSNTLSSSDIDYKILYKQLEEFPYSNDDTAIISEILDDIDIDIDFNNPILVGENKIFFKVSVTGWVALEFYIDKPDFYATFDEELEVIDDVNDYVYLVRGEFEVVLTGLCSMEIDFSHTSLDEVNNDLKVLENWYDSNKLNIVYKVESLDTALFL